jgi:hypothetical protein
MTDINPSRIWEGFSWKTPALIVPSGGSRRTRVFPGNENEGRGWQRKPRPSRKRIGCGNKQEPLRGTHPSLQKKMRTRKRQRPLPFFRSILRLPSADRDHPVINNAGEKNRKPANGPEQSVKEKRRTANPESFHRFFLRFFIVMKVDLCYHKGT